jgi:hypothetical protein
MTQGNPVALKRTIDNVKEAFGGLINDVVIGDLCVFPSDSIQINTYDATVIELPFNYLYHNGFSSCLNKLSSYATNNICLYMNVGEVIEGNIDISLLNSKYNSYMFDHATESHKWIRLWDKTQLEWSGRIHEEVVGNRKLCPTILFRMADTDKDNYSEQYSSVMNIIKEYVYWKQYIMLAENPEEIGATNIGWVNYSKESYDNLTQRLNSNKERIEAFHNGDLNKFLLLCKEESKHENDNLVHYQ